jgi:hypothetical protein
MSFSMGTGNQNQEDSGPTNHTPTDSRNVGWYRGMTKRQRRWFWIGTIIVVMICLRACASVAPHSDPQVGPAQSPSPAVVAAPAPPQAPQNGAPAIPAPVAPVDQATPKIEFVPTAPLTTFSDGMYLVGTDIQAGSYKTSGPVSPVKMGYWARMRNDSGEFSAVIANSIINGPARVSVKAGEYLEVTGGAVWTLVK